MGSDFIIVVGMFAVGSLGILGCVRGRLAFGKLGFILCAVSVCVGLAHFGWRPLFGGRQTAETYFGCLACGLGLMGLCVFGAIEEVARRYLAAPPEQRGFPVITPPAKED